MVDRNPRTAERVDNEDAGFARFWHPIARSVDVTEGTLRPVQLLGERWVVSRINGEIAVLAEACPHRLAPLSAGHVVDGTIECPYHGYRFDTDGTCVAIPSITGTSHIPKLAHARTPAAVAERHGLVWMAPETPLAPLIEVPEWDDPAWDCWWMEPISTTISAAMLIDNFLEAYHFVYLHKNTFGPGMWFVQSSERDGWHVRVETTLGEDGEEGRQIYEMRAPFSLRNAATRRDAITGTFLFFVQPVSSTESTLYFAQCYTDTHGDDEMREERNDFSRRVTAEDLGILTRYADPRIPVDVRVEVHTKQDSGGLEYRRLLAEARQPSTA